MARWGDCSQHPPLPHPPSQGPFGGLGEAPDGSRTSTTRYSAGLLTGIQMLLLCLETPTAHFNGLVPVCRSPHFSAVVQLISLPLYLLSPSYPQSNQGWQLPEAFKDLSFPRVEALSSAPGGLCHAVSLPTLFPGACVASLPAGLGEPGLGALLLSECHEKDTVLGAPSVS